MDVSILGAGGHTRSLLPLIEVCGLNAVSVYDDSYCGEELECIGGVQLTGNLSDFKNERPVVLSYGDGTMRKKLAEKFKESLYEKNLVHPSALLISNEKLGTMNQIFAGTIINSEATIGNNNIINTGAIIEHEARIGSFNHISVGAIIAGRVTIGNNCFIGAGAVVIDKVKITDNVTIGANSVVLNDIREPGTYVGNPVRKIK